MPSHSHTYINSKGIREWYGTAPDYTRPNDSMRYKVDWTYSIGENKSGLENYNTSKTGGGQAHWNVQPYMAMHYIIYVGM